MFYNLLNNKHCFERLIHFGSGAELGIPYSPYGLSKNIIYNLVKKEHGFFNIRIFGVFDENELETRFIKSSIKKYINKEPIIIHQDKQMDFFYMKDLITLVNDYLINNIHTSLSKNAECSYRKKYTLLDIANYINTLNNYKVPIQILDSSIGNKLTPLTLLGRAVLPAAIKKGLCGFVGNVDLSPDALTLYTSIS